MFRDNLADYDAFFDYGIGAMCWTRDAEGRRMLLFIAPHEPEIEGCPHWIVTRIYTRTDGKNWKEPGDVEGWDGNLETPTFSPSMWLLDREGWHGFIQNGDLVTA